ncbi:MAG: threonine/serine exporter family protein [Clostridiaceae bacterium]|nr:threonine/serine exporter family protein [Clostridiaceae bacterium]
MHEIFLSCLYSLAACLGFCLVYNLRGLKMLFASLGGALGWLVYLLCAGLQNDIMQFFLATIALSIYAEIMARIHKTPVMVFLIIALLPLVPGSGIYYTMEYAINGDTAAFMETGLHTLAIAGSLALGILLVSSLVRLVIKVRQHALA